MIKQRGRASPTRFEDKRKKGEEEAHGHGLEYRLESLTIFDCRGMGRRAGGDSDLACFNLAVLGVVW